jgi:hypothetical protein
LISDLDLLLTEEGFRDWVVLVDASRDNLITAGVSKDSLERD